MKLKFYLWNLYNNVFLNIDEYIPKDGNATEIAKNQNKIVLTMDIDAGKETLKKDR